MILNDGRYTVETNDAVVLAVSPWLKTGDGYGYESDDQCTLYRTRGGAYFIVREYVEHICGVAKIFGAKPKRGHVLYVYETPDEALDIWRYRGFDVPNSEMKALK